MATSLKHVSESLKSSKEITADESNNSSLFEMETPVVETQKPEREYVVFKLCKKKRGRTYVDGICDNVLNPKTKRRERIWLLNGADSIWQTEITELLKDKDYLTRNRRSIQFEDGVCRIKVNDERALEFARATTHNVGRGKKNTGGKFDFYEYDPQVEQEEKLKSQRLKIDLLLKVSNMDAAKMKKLASFMGIVFVDDIGMEKGDEGIRSELLIKVDNNPTEFAKHIDSAEVEISYMVKMAIRQAKIDLQGQSGNAIWAGGKGFIAKIPAARKAHEYLTELAMTNSDEGRAFKEQLQTMIK